MSEHLTRKELKQDKVRETFEHGAEAVLGHKQLALYVVLALLVVGGAFLGWKAYSDNQNSKAQVEFDEALKIYNAPLANAGQPVMPGQLTYPTIAERAQDAETKFAGVAAKFPSTRPGKLARYYSALCMMDLDKLNQASEELNKLNAGSDKELSAMANYQRALIAERTGKTDDAVKILRELSNAGSVLVPKPMVLLELASALRPSDPKQAAKVYAQIVVEYPNTAMSDQATREMEALPPTT